jgi:hypothetical protein
VGNVIKNNFKKGLLTAFLVMSSSAWSDQKYPAADFQPTVVYQDDDYIAKSGQAKSTTSATSNQAASSPAPSSSTSQSVDPKYPAANFEPKVVYADPSYQHTSSTNSSTSGSVVDGAASEDSNSTQAKSDDSSSSFLIGLALFAAVGFVLFKKRPENQSTTSSKANSKDATGLTGVSKYLNRTSGTGVARYLEKQVKSVSSSATTGVAKYMATKQTSVKKSNTTEAKTGVEKYMRKRG